MCQSPSPREKILNFWAYRPYWHYCLGHLCPREEKKAVALGEVLGWRWIVRGKTVSDRPAGPFCLNLQADPGDHRI